MNNPSWMAFSRNAVAAAVAIVVAAPVLAQNTSSAVTGRVVGADGKGVAAAAVSVRHVESGSVTNVTTDAEGRYTARGLRVGGPYTVTFTKGGLSDKREGLVLALAETLTLDSVLGASTSSLITVTGSAVSSKFNSASVGAGTSLGSKELNSLASINRNLQDYARLDPRLSQTDKERGEISAGGQNTRYNSITIDGVSISDSFGLESNNLPTKKQPISMDAIQSAQVNLSNYDVTQKGYTGANINAVTKSGTNELKGSAYYVFRDESLAGQRFNRTAGTYFAAPKFDESTAGFTLGGPIIKDKLFFFINYEDFKSSRNTPVFGPVGSPLTNVQITTQMIADAQKVAKDVYGVDVGTLDAPPGTALRVKETLAKLDWNISDAHRANLRYSKTEQTEPIFTGYSATGLALSSYNYNQVKTNESVVAQWFADWTDNFSTELKVSQRDYRSEPLPMNGVRLPQIALRFDGNLPSGATSTTSRFLNLGTERSRHFNVLETKTADVYAGATWNVGNHEVKGGVDYAENEVFNAFLQDTNGNYTFRCENGTYTFAGTTTPVTVNCATADANTVAAVVLHNFRNGNPSSYSVQLPQAGRTINDGVANWTYGNTGVFLQDTWKVSKNLSVNVGMRADQQNVPSKPLANTAAAAPMVAGNASTNTPQTGGFGLDNTVTLDGNVLVQPRAGFNLKLGDETRRQLRGGFGLFQGAAANVWLSNPFSNTGKAVVTYSCTTFSTCASTTVAGSTTPGVKFSANPDAQPVLSGVVPAANVDFVSGNLEQPSVWKANLAFETELPELPVVGKLVAGAEWLYTKTKSGIYYKNLNLGTVTATGSDGRELFYNAQGRNMACWNANGSSITSGTGCAGFSARALRNLSFNNVFLAEETNKGGGNAITLSLQQPGLDGLSWLVAYTRTSATEVSPLTSSTSSSNWGNRNIFNPNEEVASNSNYLIRDRFSANMSWSKALVGNYKTTVGVTYEGRKGKPYSWTYINDLNGDGVAGNDLMYIPSAPGSGEVEFRTAADEARFWAVVDSTPGLSGARGSVVKANTSTNPWVNTFDLRVSQELPGFTSKHKAAFVMDFMNVGNFLNKKWGRIDEVGFPSNRSFVNYNGLNAAGKYVYSVGTTEDYQTRQESGESQWAVQFTLRYEF